MSILADLNPESLAIKALVVIAALGGVYTFAHHQGYKGEKLAFDDYVLKQKGAADDQIIANKDALKAQRAAFNAQLEQLHSEYTDNAQHLKASRDAALASASDYSDKLRRYIASSHDSRQQSVVSDTPSGANGIVGTGSSGLVDGVSSLNWYLTQRFSDADGLAVKFNEAVQLIAQDRKVCNGSLPGVTPQ